VKVGELLDDAWKDQQEKNGEHTLLPLMIFDELNSTRKKGGTVTGADSLMVLQFWITDNVDSLDHVLLMGMANRLDLVDERRRGPDRTWVAGRARLRADLSHPHRAFYGPCESERAYRAYRAHSNYTGVAIGGVVESGHDFALRTTIDPDTEKLCPGTNLVVVNGEYRMMRWAFRMEECLLKTSAPMEVVNFSGEFLAKRMLLSIGSGSSLLFSGKFSGWTSKRNNMLDKDRRNVTPDDLNKSVPTFAGSIALISLTFVRNTDDRRVGCPKSTSTRKSLSQSIRNQARKNEMMRS
jgi:hypothetical protein